ncbi:hypothetical protein D3C81_1834450 [compost metagenome]
MKSVRIFSENFRLSGLEILSGFARLPKASAAMSSPISSARVCTGTHSLAIAAPPVSACPPLSLCANTPPATIALSTLMPLAGFQAGSFFTIEFWIFCKAE